MGLNIEEPWQISAAEKLQCKISVLPFTYLDLPIGGMISRVSSWDPIIERMRRKLATWKGKLLSLGGRLTLIKASLSNLPLYYMSIFPIPQEVIDKITKIQRDFFWCNFAGNKLIPLVKWETIQISKEAGGLGVGNLLTRNLGLLLKWIWRFYYEPNSTWRQLVEVKYKYPANPTMADFSRINKGGPWRNICNSILSHEGSNTALKTLMRKSVGNGQKTRFWLDVWIGEVPLKLVFPRLFSVTSDPLATISLQGYWDGPEWRWSFSWGRTLRARDKVEWTELQQLLAQVCLGPDEPDKLIWVPNKSGLFTVKSFCQEMSKTNPSTLKEAAHKLWKGIVPHRIEIFAWIAMMEKLNTREKLAKLNIIQCNENQCALCELEPESSSHLFLQCSVARQIWNWWLKLWNLSWVLPLSIKDTFIQWHYPRKSKFFKKIWAASFFVILWSLWKERNARAFSNKSLPPSDLQDLIILRLSWWVKGWAPEFPYSPDEVRRNPTCLQWFSAPQKSAIQKLSPMVLPLDWPIKMEC